MCSSAFMSHPCLFYHNPIANIAVMSVYMQSGGANAGFRPEVSNTWSQCRKGDFDFDWKIFWDTTSLTHYRSNSRIPLRRYTHLPLSKEMEWNWDGWIPLSSMIDPELLHALTDLIQLMTLYVFDKSWHRRGLCHLRHADFTVVSYFLLF